MTYTATPATMHSGHDIRDTNGSMVAIVHNPAANPAEGARIAALMAAAPELLAALEELLWSTSGTSLESDGDYSNAFTAAHAAIARAKGAV